jgi:cytochrome c biogenesis protein
MPRGPRSPPDPITHPGEPVIATAAVEPRRRNPDLIGPFARVGWLAWRTLTSVKFAVLLIISIAVAGLIGTVVRQFPAFALHNSADYAAQVAEMHRLWDSITLLGLSIGPGLVDVFDRLGFFRVFSAPWFLALLSVLVVAIICCTLDRTPRMWRQVRNVRVDQPAAFFDVRLADRALLEHSALSDADVARAFRRHRFRVRSAASPDGTVSVYGDRNQYSKMATLLTHLGLILFLAGGAITVGLGFETVVFVGEGQTAPVQPVGTPDNLLVKVNSFEAPRRADGSFEDFRTDLSVYQNGEQVARKTIRVNDPLEVQGFVFHQNTFGPSADLEVRDSASRLVWTGPVILAGQVLGLPQGFLTIPGSDLGLLLLLRDAEDGTALLELLGLGPTDSTGASSVLFAADLGLGGSSDPAVTGGYSVTWARAGGWTGMVIRNDPGQNLIWVAFGSLIAGLVFTFYFPRRRVWARLEGDTLRLAMLGDRYVDVPRELGRLIDDLQRVKGQPAPAGTRA